MHLEDVSTGDIVPSTQMFTAAFFLSDKKVESAHGPIQIWSGPGRQNHSAIKRKEVIHETA